MNDGQLDLSVKQFACLGEESKGRQKEQWREMMQDNSGKLFFREKGVILVKEFGL